MVKLCELLGLEEFRNKKAPYMVAKIKEASFPDNFVELFFFQVQNIFPISTVVERNGGKLTGKIDDFIKQISNKAGDQVLVVVVVEQMDIKVVKNSADVLGLWPGGKYLRHERLH